MKTKEKFMSVVGTATSADGQKHEITVVGRLVEGHMRVHNEEPVQVSNGHKTIANGILMYKKNTFFRQLTVGMSICHPDDEFSKEFGEHIAKKRIKHGDDRGSLMTHDVTMLTPDQVEATLNAKLAYYVANIDSIIEKK